MTDLIIEDFADRRTVEAIAETFDVDWLHEDAIEFEDATDSDIDYVRLFVE